VDRSVQTLSLAFTYLPPRVSIGTPSNIHSFGQQIIPILGINFGSYAITPFVSIGLTNCEASTWDSDTGVTCKSARGFTSTLSLVVSIASVEPMPMKTDAMSYDSALISVVSVTNLQLGEYQQVQTIGYGLSPIDFTPKASFYQTATESTQWISDTSLVCMISQGFSQTLRMQVTAGVSVQSTSEIVSYDFAIISDLSKYNLASILKETIVVSGLSFAHSALTSQGRVAGSSSESSEWFSDSSVLAKAAGGSLQKIYTGTQLNALVVTAGRSAGSISGAVTYDLQFVSGSHTGNSASRGQSPLHILLVNMGSEDYTISGATGYTECEASKWTSDSTLRCQTATGFLASYSLHLTASEREVSMTESFSYNAPSVNVSNLSSTNAVTLTIAEQYNETWASFSGTFGSLQQSMVGGIGLTSCEATLWISDSMLTCKTSFSLATSMRVILTAGANVGTGTDALSFAAGRVEKLYQGARNHSNLVPTMPGSAQVLGAFFRHQSYTITLEVGHTACERTDWVSTSTVSCSVPVGSKATQVLKFTASIRTLTTTEMWSFDILRFSNLQPANHVSRIRSITLDGSNIGLWHLSPSAHVGFTNCERTSWLSDSSASCNTAVFSMGASLRLRLTAGEAASTLTNAFSFDLFSANQQSRLNTGSRLSRNLTVFTLDMGNFEFSSYPRPGFTSSEQSIWLSQSSLLCLGAWGVQSTRTVVISSGLQLASRSEIFSYDVPLLTTLSSTNMAQFSTRLIYNASISNLEGLQFGNYQSSVGSRAGVSAAELSLWLSSSVVACKTVAGHKRSLHVLVTAGIQEGSVTGAASFDLQSSSRTDTSNVPTVGGLVVSISGSHYGIFEYTARGRAGQTMCEEARWTSDSAVNCKISKGVDMSLTCVDNHCCEGPEESGSLTEWRIKSEWKDQNSIVCRGVALPPWNSVLSITVSDSRTELSDSYSYSMPTIILGQYGSRITPVNNLQTQGRLFSIAAVNLGYFDRTLRASIGFTTTEVTRWSSDTTITCSSASGTSFSLAVMLTSNMRVMTTSEVLTYDSVVMTGMSPKNAPVTVVLGLDTSYAQILTGTHLPAWSSSMVRILGSPTERTWWMSQSSISCLCSAGMSRSSRLSVTFGNNVGSASDFISFDAPLISVGRVLNQPSVQGRSAPTMLNGLNFMRSSITSTRTFGHSACESSTWLSDTALSAKAAGGLSKTRSIVMSILSYTGSISQAASYDAFDISSIRTSNQPSHALGKMGLIVSSSIFARHYTSAARSGCTACGETTWSSFTTVNCKGSFSTGRSQMVIVTAAIVSQSTSNAFSFDVVDMSSSVPGNAPLTGEVQLSVFGQSMAVFDYTVAIRTDRTACPISSWTSDSSVSCLVPFGVHVSEPKVLVTNAGSMRTWTDSFSYDTKSTARFVEVDQVYTNKAIQQLYYDSSFFDEKFVDEQTSHTDASVFVPPGSNNEHSEFMIDGVVNDPIPWSTHSPPKGEEYIRNGASNIFKVLPITPDQSQGWTYIVVHIAPNGGMFELKRVKILWGSTTFIPSHYSLRVAAHGGQYSKEILASAATMLESNATSSAYLEMIRTQQKQFPYAPFVPGYEPVCRNEVGDTCPGCTELIELPRGWDASYVIMNLSRYAGFGSTFEDPGVAYSVAEVQVDAACISEVCTLVGNFVGFVDGDGRLRNREGAVKFNKPASLELSPDGTLLYVMDSGNHAIRMVTVDSLQVSTVVGGKKGYADGVGAGASFAGLSHMILHPDAKRLFVTDAVNNNIRQIDLINGHTSTVAGSSDRGYVDGTAANSKWNTPRGIAVSSNGDELFIADQGNHRLRKISLTFGNVSTLAGNGIGGLADGIGTRAETKEPWGITVSPDGRYLFFSMRGGFRLRQLNLVTSEVYTIAGRSEGSYSGIGMHAQFGYTYMDQVVWGEDGNVMYFTDSGQNIIRYYEATNQYVGTLAGSNPGGKPGGSGNVAGHRDGEASSALFDAPFGLAIDRMRGIIYASDSNGHRLRTVTFRSQTPKFSIPGGQYNLGPGQTAVTVIAWAGDNVKVHFTADGSEPTLNSPYMIPQIQWERVCTSCEGAGEQAYEGMVTLSECKQLCIKDRRCISINHDGNRFLPGLCILNVVSSSAHWSVNLDVFPAFFANACARQHGQSDTWCAEGPALKVRSSFRQVHLHMYKPRLCIDSSQGVLELKGGKHLVRAMAKTPGLPPSSRTYMEVQVAEMDVSTFAGLGEGGTTDNYGMSDGYGTSATFSQPVGIAISPSGTVFVLERNTNEIRALDSVTAASWTVSKHGSSIYLPSKVAVSKDGSRLFVIDFTVDVDVGGARIQHLKLHANGRNVTTYRTIAGSSEGIQGHQDGAGGQALFHGIQGIALWEEGETAVLYVTCSRTHTIRRIDVASGQVSTFLGSGDPNMFGHADGDGAQALFNRPWSIVMAADRTSLYLSEFRGAHIRKVMFATHQHGVIVSTIQATGENGYAFSFHSTLELAMGSDLNIIWIGDNGNFTLHALSLTSNKVLSTYGNGIKAHVDGMSHRCSFMGFSQMALAQDGSALFTTHETSANVRSVFAGRVATPKFLEPPSGRYFVPSTAVR
jgi:sugar lactone lactonase YvrE